MKTTTGKSKSMSILSCDLEACSSKFYTASFTGLTRKQARGKGWKRTTLGRALKHLQLDYEAAGEKFRGGAHG